MSDSESGGEHTNAEYYKHIWGKPVKNRTAPKPTKPKPQGGVLPQKRKGKIVRRKAVRPPLATNR